MKNMFLPGFVGLVGISLMAFGVYKDGSFTGLGFVLLATSFVTGASWYGASKSIMKVSEPSIKTSEPSQAT